MGYLPHFARFLFLCNFPVNRYFGLVCRWCTSTKKHWLSKLAKRKYAAGCKCCNKWWDGLPSIIYFVWCSSDYFRALRKITTKYSRLFCFKSLGTKRLVFTSQQEQKLVNYLNDIEARLFVLTITECKQLVFQLAEQNQIEHLFNQNFKIARSG